MTVAPSGLTLSELLLAVRRDLADTNSTNYRWSDDVLKRQVSRTVDEYSRVSPNLVNSQIPTIPQSRIYPEPPGCWWLERVEYPIGRFPKRYITFQELFSPLIPPPTTASAAINVGGGLPGETFQYATTFTVPGYGVWPSGAGETTPSPLSAPAVITSLGSIQVSAIPTGPYGVTGRNLYRTKAGGSFLYLLTSLPDNTTTTYTDTAPDSALGALAPTRNLSSGISQFELSLSDGMLPPDTTGIMQLTAAYHHELDGAGTTIPQKHWDVITLGTEAYALFQYLTTTNDNLDYVDGQFRDRVDDTKAPPAWYQQAENTMARYQARLKDLRNEISYSATPYPQWGDVPMYWDRL